MELPCHATVGLCKILDVGLIAKAPHGGPDETSHGHPAAGRLKAIGAVIMGCPRFHVIRLQRPMRRRPGMEL